MRPDQITVVKAHADDLDVADEFGVKTVVAELDRGNFRQTLQPLLGSGDFLLNLSVDVSSTSLIELCRERGALYLDTCIGPWPDAFSTSTPLAQRTNYALREAALKLRTSGPAPTAVLTQGANPGLVSQFVKQALLNIAHDTGLKYRRPATRGDWAGLARSLGVRVIHIADRDTQACAARKQPDEFVNTWSVEGFIDEGKQPSELGWGSHERHGPAAPDYRSTVHYAYHPCDDAVLSVHELEARNWEPQKGQRLIRDEIVAGRDELGVLLMGHARGAYWYGSQLTIDEARRLCPHNNATSLQVSAPVMAGVVWAIKNPSMGIAEPEDLPFDEILRICRPYLGPVVGVYSDWTPLAGRGQLFDEDLDHDDPWQFKNFRVV
jgi:homospermidine synthase